MGFSGIVFFEDVDLAVLGNVAALAGTPYRTQGDDAFVPPDFNQIFMAYAWGENTITRAQFEAPSMVTRGAYEIRPIDLALIPTPAFPMHKFLETPIILDEGEAMNWKGTNSGGAADRHHGMLWLSDGNLAPVKDPDEITIRATATITCVADTWSQGQMTLDRDLRVGEYALVGARVESATAHAFRFIPANSNARPMVIGYATGGLEEDSIFRHGNLGTWLTFQHDAPPQIECLATTTDSAQTLTLDIVKLS